jgi:hypothetical protein
MEICPLEAELFLANGQTDMAKLIVAFSNFVNAPEKGHTCVVSGMLSV